MQIDNLSYERRYSLRTNESLKNLNTINTIKQDKNKNIMNLNIFNTPVRNIILKKEFNSKNIYKTLEDNKKIYTPSKIIKTPRSIISFTSNNTSNNIYDINNNNKYFEKKFIDKSDNLFSLIKIFNNKINDIIQYLNEKSSEINHLFLFQKKVDEFQDKIILFFEKIIEDLNFSKNIENINELNTHLNKFYNNFFFKTDYFVQILQMKNITINNNSNNNIKSNKKSSIKKRNHQKISKKVLFMDNIKLDNNLIIVK